MGRDGAAAPAPPLLNRHHGWPVVRHDQSRTQQRSYRFTSILYGAPQLVFQFRFGREVGIVRSTPVSTVSASWSSVQPRTSRQHTRNVCTSPCSPATAGGTRAR